MIALEQLLDGLEVEVEPFLVNDLHRSGTPDRRQIKGPMIHATRSGAGVLELEGGATVRFSPHDVILLPAKGPRTVPESGRRSKVTAPAPGSRASRATGEAGTKDADIRTACGQIRVTYRNSVGMFDHLREPLVENLHADDPIRRSFDELLDEVAAQRPGFRAMVEILVRRCLILLLRRHFERTDCRLSWPAALDDARLGLAVAAMQDRPEHSFTLRALAEMAGMSRSVFAARFANALGHSPIEFLKRLRLGRAAQLLSCTDLPVKTIAGRIGYSSRSSFTRAFAARHGVGPAVFRAAARKSPAEPFATHPTASERPPEVA